MELLKRKFPFATAFVCLFFSSTNKIYFQISLRGRFKIKYLEFYYASLHDTQNKNLLKMMKKLVSRYYRVPF
jgi:hypothetical protein